MSGESEKRVTSRDVAAAAGVSQATVARVFSSPELVAVATQEQVRRAAAELGYVPNAIARSLKSQRTDIVGAVVPAQGEYWQSVLTVLSRRLADRGKQLLLFSFSDVDHVQEAIDSVEQYRLDGLVLASSTIGHQHMAGMHRSGPPVVAFNQPAADGLLPLVSVDNEAGTSALAEHLALRGIGSAVFVGGVAAASTDQMRYRGAVATLAEHGIACPYLEAGSFTYDAGYKAAAAILAADELPDGLIVGSDEVAFGLIDGLRVAGVDVPSDVLVTGFDGLPQASWAGYRPDDPGHSPSSHPGRAGRWTLLIDGDDGSASRTRRGSIDGTRSVIGRTTTEEPWLRSLKDANRQGSPRLGPRGPVRAGCAEILIADIEERGEVAVRELSRSSSTPGQPPSFRLSARVRDRADVVASVDPRTVDDIRFAQDPDPDLRPGPAGLDRRRSRSRPCPGWSSAIKQHPGLSRSGPTSPAVATPWWRRPT